jgi:hypothetical protein
MIPKIKEYHFPSTALAIHAQIERKLSRRRAGGAAHGKRRRKHPKLSEVIDNVIESGKYTSRKIPRVQSRDIPPPVSSDIPQTPCEWDYIKQAGYERYIAHDDRRKELEKFYRDQILAKFS